MMRGDGLRNAMPPGEFDRMMEELRQAETKQESRSPEPPATKASRSRSRSRGQASPDPKVGPAEGPGATQQAAPAAAPGPILFRPTGGSPLPDTPEALMDVLNRPDNVAHGIEALQKLGELYGRDVVEDNSNPSAADFNPMIIATGVGSNPQAVSSFVGYAVPLRRALARYFNAKTPDIAMLVDMLTIAYWKAVQAERASVTYLAAAIEKPYYVDKVPKLEMVKELAVRQMTRLLEALRVATGRQLTIDPDEDIAKVLRFPQTVRPLHRRVRKASAG